jgi:chromosome segregation ATPase
MDDQGKKEDSWIRKLPKIIVGLLVLIFVIIVFSNHNQYKKWQAEQSELTGKVKQTAAKLDNLQEASGSLQDVTKKAETLKQQAANMAVALEKLIEEKNSTDSALSRLRKELRDLNGQVSAGRNKVAELTKESDTLQSTNQRLRGDIVNKKSVLDSIKFLQRQIPLLEQNIQDLKTRNDLAAKVGLEQQAKLEAFQNKIKEGEAAIKAQNERRTALNNELSELTETVKKLSAQKEDLAMLDDLQKKLEYLENLQQQKESMEILINNLLEKGKMLETENLKLQQSGPTR